MSNRVLRAGFFAVPILSLTFGLIAACSDEGLDPAIPGADASADVTVLPDGSQGGVDANRPDTGNNSDSGGGEDAGADADAEPLPPLCLTYPNSDQAGADAAVGEPDGGLLRYQMLVYRTIRIAGGANGSPVSTCEISAHFDESTTLYDPPQQPPCLELQLQALAGCSIGGVPVDYSNVQAEGDRCANGTAGIHLGFREPALNAYTKADVEKFIDIIHAQAISVGYTPTDADRLKALLLDKMTTVVPADRTDAGYSKSVCP
jgi:hypothetical protein